MKKLIALICLAAFAMAVVGCGKEEVTQAKVPDGVGSANQVPAGDAKPSAQ